MPGSSWLSYIHRPATTSSDVSESDATTYSLRKFPSVARSGRDANLIDTNDARGAEGKLAPEVYRAVFARNRRAYYGSRHWSSCSRAQLVLTSFCEVERCRRPDELQVRQLHDDAVGEEQAGRDLVTLCQGCVRRAHKWEQELGRPAARDELLSLDPLQPLYDAAAIAALKAKHRRALRRSDHEPRR